jgi:hypothetical protein
MKSRIMRYMKINTKFGITLKIRTMLLIVTGSLCLTSGSNAVIPEPHKMYLCFVYFFIISGFLVYKIKISLFEQRKLSVNYRYII